MTSDPLDALAEEFLDRLRRGEPVTTDSYCASHPEFAARIREVFPAIAAVEDLKVQRFGGVVRESGEQFGDFRILRELGRGGMGIVYEAEQISLRRRVALKVLPALAQSDRAAVDRFHREAHIAAGMHHTNIVSIYGTGEVDECPYYAMQRIEGLGLDVVIRRAGGSDSLDEMTHAQAVAAAFGDGEGQDYDRGVAQIGLQIASAVAYAHAHGVLHRDIKPANLLLDTSGTPWVTDFGLARALDRQGLTMSGDIVGTLRYMAPEQANGEGDARSDVYGLGLTLFELLTRQPAFSGESQTELFKSILEGRRASLRGLRSDLHPDLITIVERACAADVEQRYASAEALREDLQRFLEDRPILARHVTITEVAWRWCRRNRAVASLATASIALLLLATGVGWIGWVNTTGALEREQQARSLANTNLSLSLEAFEQVFESLVGLDPLGPMRIDPEFGEMPLSSPPVSVKDMLVLQRLLQFYDKFAASNADVPRLHADAALARRRIGDLLQRLGRIDDARDAYREALAFLDRRESDSGLIERVRIHNAIGRLELARSNARSATERHLRALDALGSRSGVTEQNPDASTIEFELERARTHNLIGAALLSTGSDTKPSEPRGTGGRRGNDRGGKRTKKPRRVTEEFRKRAMQHHDAARVVAETLAKKVDDPRATLVLTRCFRLRAEAGSLLDRKQARADLELAQKLLTELVEEHPGVVHYQAELAEALIAGQFWSRLENDAASAPLTKLKRAVAIYTKLNKGDPSSPRYRAGLARSTFELGAVLPFEAGVVHMRAAVSTQGELAREWPKVPRYLIGWAWMSMATHRAMRRNRQRRQANTMLQYEVDGILQTLGPRRRGKERVIARRAVELLLRGYEEIGDRAKARALEDQARLLND